MAMTELEVELLRRTWFPVARWQDVVHHPTAARLLDVDLVVYRHSAGVTVAQGMCPHRWAALADGPMVGDELECPYHGWRFDHTGQLVAVPSLPRSAALPRCALTTYPARVAYGLVWTCLDDPWLAPPVFDVVPADWTLVEHPNLPHFTAGEWHLAWGDVADVHCGMRALHENFADMSHFAWVHSRTMGAVGPVIPEYEVEPDGTSMRYRLRNLPADADEHDDADLAVVMRRRTNDYHVHFPAITTIRSASDSAGARFVGQLVSPTSTDGEHVRNFWFAGLDATMRERTGATIVESFAYDASVTVEDYPVLEASRPREQPLSSRDQISTRADVASIAYRRLFRRLLSTYAQAHDRPDPFVRQDEP